MLSLAEFYLQNDTNQMGLVMYSYFCK